MRHGQGTFRISLPTGSFNGSKVDTIDPRLNWYVGVGLNWRVFEGLRNYHHSESTDALMTAGQADEESLRQTVAAEIQLQLMVVDEASKRIKVVERALVTSEGEAAIGGRQIRRWFRQHPRTRRRAGGLFGRSLPIGSGSLRTCGGAGVAKPGGGVVTMTKNARAWLSVFALSLMVLSGCKSETDSNGAPRQTATVGTTRHSRADPGDGRHSSNDWCRSQGWLSCFWKGRTPLREYRGPSKKG